MTIAPKRVLAAGIVLAAAIAGLGIGAGPEPPAAPARRGSAAIPVPRGFGPIQPRLSDGGEHIAFSYQGAIWRMPRAGGVMTRLTDDRGFDAEPAWSPDCTLIAYFNAPGFPAGTLRIIRADDGTPVPVPQPIRVGDRLDFDRAGKRILGRFQPADQEPALGWFDLGTGSFQPVPTPGLQPQRYALSQDGRWIVFSTTRDTPGVKQSGDDGPEAGLWKVPAEGGPAQKIAAVSARVNELCWGPLDTALYVVTELGGVHNDLWEIPLADPVGGARRLTFGAADEDRPSVSRDGRWLLYTDNHQGPTALVLRDLATGKDELIEPTALDFRRPSGRLALGLADAADGSPLSARVAIRNTAGKYHAPPGALYRLLRGDLHFYAFDQAALELPEGHYEAKVARGPEYRIARVEFDVRQGETTRLTVTLERWTDQRKLGWYSGESHIHANYGFGHWYNSPRTMLLQCGGEDLNVSNFMVANSNGDGVFDREYFRGRPDPLSQAGTILSWNEEFRSTIWGHMTLLGLDHLVEPIFTGFAHTTQPWDAPTNGDVADLTHDQHGLVNYTHPAVNPKDPYLGPYTAKELPIDAALGKVDSIDVMGTNHEATVPLWYALLNCGFHLPASAGTDCFVNRIASRVPGAGRAYVRVQGPFSYGAWIEGLKAGRTFVTNGPMLEFTAGGQGAGATIRIEPGAGLRVEALARAQSPLDRLDVVLNGRVVTTARAGGDRLSVAIDETIPIERSGWIALRASGPNHPDQPDGTVYAHTGPVYIEVPGKPIDARADAERFIAWIDRLSADVRHRDRVPARSRAHVEGQLAAAREVYTKLRQGP
jgi:hypothetical protein